MTSSSWYRRSVFGIKGNREYTTAGFEHAKQRFGEKDLDVDCSDRHFLVTGGNSGIGLATALEVAKRGGILHLVCRNAKSMKEARSHIITTTGNDRIYQHQVNLAKPEEVAKWAKEFAETQGRLDVLIHNAGLLQNEREVDENGVETMFAVHTLAVHLITLILLPVLRRSNDPRVIIVSSAGMLTVKLDSSDLNFEKMNPFIGRLAYSQTKRQQVVMNFSYAQRYEKIKFYSMHPGWVDTPGLRKGMPDFYEQTKDKLRTPEQGADTVIWLAISEAALKHSSGLFFQDRLPTVTHLPLAWTRTSTTEEQQFMTILDKLFVQYSSLDPSEIPKFSGHPDRVELNSEHQSVLRRPSEDDSEETEKNPVTNLNHEVEGRIEEAATIINEENLIREETHETDKSESSEHNQENEPIAVVSSNMNQENEPIAVVSSNMNQENEPIAVVSSNMNQENEPIAVVSSNMNDTTHEEERINVENNSLHESTDDVPPSVFENSTEITSQKVEQVTTGKSTDASQNGILKNESVIDSSDISSGDNTNKNVERSETLSDLVPESTTTTLEETREGKALNDLKAPESLHVEGTNENQR